MNPTPVPLPLPSDLDVERFDIFKLLRKGTADIHELTEQRVPVFREGFDREDYARLVEHFFGFWVPVEERLSQLTALRDPGLGLQSRFKSSLLREDLHFLGRDPASVRHCEILPPLDTLWQGLGCLYVLEGSTLGSQIISRRLREKLQLREQSGASFFNAYGGSIRSRWAEFQLVVSAWVMPGNAEEVVQSARQTFLCFYEWLGTASVMATRP